MRRFVMTTMVTDDNCTAVLSAVWADASDGVVAYFLGYETPENRIYWWIADYACDVIYILDIILVKRRLQFINNGMLEVRRHANSLSTALGICEIWKKNFNDSWFTFFGG